MEKKTAKKTVKQQPVKQEVSLKEQTVTATKTEKTLAVKPAAKTEKEVKKDEKTVKTAPKKAVKTDEAKKTATKIEQKAKPEVKAEALPVNKAAEKPAKKATKTKKTVIKAEEKNETPLKAEAKTEVKTENAEKPVEKITVTKKRSVVFIGSEAAPFIATGGLADVLGSLPEAISENGNYDVSVILPMYSAINYEWRKNFEYVTNFSVNLSWRTQYCGVFKYVYRGVTFYFLDNEYYFKRDGKIYGHYDDAERFAFFSKAALDTIAHLDIYPDVVHCNDWQTAPAIIYLKGMYYPDERFRRIKTVFTIHNIEYQGKYGMELYGDLFGFDPSLYNYVEYESCVNLMKGAIEMSDKVTTVSPTYANEIKDPYFAHGLENVIERNAFKLSGILNGIDYEYYNPATDTHIEKNYSINDMSGKKVCKTALQKLLNLPEREDVPLTAMVSRLVSHKGLDLVKGVIEQYLSEDVQFVLLGTGEAEYENYFRYLQNAYPDKVRAIIAFNLDLSRKVYAGSDIFLMPSRNEPCGLSQMIASRYGTVSVVRETGGLNDSIKAFYEGNGNGFTFKGYNAYDMLYVLREAKNCYYDKALWGKAVANAMNSDFSWKNSATEYEKLYD